MCEMEVYRVPFFISKDSYPQSHSDSFRGSPRKDAQIQMFKVGKGIRFKPVIVAKGTHTEYLKKGMNYVVSKFNTNFHVPIRWFYGNIVHKCIDLI